MKVLLIANDGDESIEQVVVAVKNGTREEIDQALDDIRQEGMWGIPNPYVLAKATVDEDFEDEWPDGRHYSG